MSGDFIKPTVDSDYLFTHKLVCPTCDYEYASINSAEHLRGNDNYTPGPNRGGQWILSGECEQGHQFEIVFGFHKGNTFVGTRPKVDPDASH